MRLQPSPSLNWRAKRITTGLLFAPSLSLREEAELSTEIHHVVFPGHCGPDVLFTSNGFVAVPHGRTISLLDMHYGGLVRFRCVGHRGDVRRLWSLNSTDFGGTSLFDLPVFASASHDRSVRIWNCLDGRQLARFEGRERLESICSVNWLMGILGGELRRPAAIRVWDAFSGRLRTRLTGHTRGVSAMDACEELKIVLSGSKDRTLKAWDLRVGRPVMNQRLEGEVAAVHCCRAPGQAGLVLSLSQSRFGAVHVHDLRKNALLQQIAVHDARGYDGGAIVPVGEGIFASCLGRDGATWSLREKGCTVDLGAYTTGICRLRDPDWQYDLVEWALHRRDPFVFLLGARTEFSRGVEVRICASDDEDEEDRTIVLFGWASFFRFPESE